MYLYNKNTQGNMFPSSSHNTQVDPQGSTFNCGISFRKVAMARKVLLRSYKGTKWTTGFSFTWLVWKWLEDL